MEQNHKRAYYRLEINTINGSPMVNDFWDYTDEEAQLTAMIHYVKRPHRYGYTLHKYDQNDTCGTFHLMGKYEESTAIG